MIRSHRVDARRTESVCFGHCPFRSEKRELGQPKKSTCPASGFSDRMAGRSNARRGPRKPLLGSPYNTDLSTDPTPRAARLWRSRYRLAFLAGRGRMRVWGTLRTVSEPTHALRCLSATDFHGRPAGTDRKRSSSACDTLGLMRYPSCTLIIAYGGATVPSPRGHLPRAIARSYCCTRHPLGPRGQAAVQRLGTRDRRRILRRRGGGSGWRE